MISGFSWQNFVSLCPASFCTLRPNLPVTPGISWLPNFALLSPMMKRIQLALLLLFSCSVISDSLQLHGLQHIRLPCPLLSPRVYLDSCPLSQRYHPTISSSVIPFTSCLQSFPASESFPVSWLFTLSAQSIGASASVLPINIQHCIPLGLTDLISLHFQGPTNIFSKWTFRS